MKYVLLFVNPMRLLVYRIRAFFPAFYEFSSNENGTAAIKCDKYTRGSRELYTFFIRGVFYGLERDK